MPSDLSVTKLARRLLRLERDLVTLSTTPRLGNSSIDGGGAIVINNPVTGQPEVIIGNQGDGTNMSQQVSGPTPPQPSTPTAAGQLGFITVTWDGHYADDVTGDAGEIVYQVPAPADFSRVEVHVSTDPGFVPDPDVTLRGTIESPRGGQLGVSADYDTTYYYRLVVRSLSGKPSLPSAVSAGTMARKVETPDVGPDFQVSGGSIADFSLVVTKFHSLQHLIY